MHLSPCSRCEGLAPSHLSVCPHCEAPRGPRPLSRALRVLGGGAVAMTLMACYGGPPGYYPPPTTSAGDCASTADDVDGDGFCAADCDQVNAEIHPGADDRAGDGYDQNCDGIDGVQGIDGGTGAPTGAQGQPPAGAQLATEPAAEPAPTGGVVVEPEP